MRTEAAEDPILFVVWSGCEVDGVGVAAISAVAHLQRPKPIDDKCLTVKIANLIDESARLWIVGIDLTVAEVADPQRPAELSESGRRHRHTPRRIKLAMLCESLQEVTLEIEDIDDAMTHTGYVVVLCRVLYGVSDKELSAEEHDVERGVPGR